MELTMSLKEGTLHAFLNVGRQIALSKTKTPDEARFDEIRPILIKSHLTKIIEMATLGILYTAAYQVGFKEGKIQL
jgi:uncharacterized Fe-S cluster-containing radical SAM superfamily protein